MSSWDVTAAAARLSVLRARVLLAKAIQHYPAGTPGGRGGQFAPAGGSGGGGGGHSGAPAAGGASHPPPPDISRFRQDHPAVHRLRQRLEALDRFAAAGDVQSIRSMVTSRGNSYLNTLDDHRSALLQHFEPAARMARLRGSVPDAPDIRGANMENSALASARRHVERLTHIAQHAADPAAALRDYRIGGGGRTNGYLRDAQGYHAALSAHFARGESAAGAASAASAMPTQPPAPAPRQARPASAPAGVEGEGGTRYASAHAQRRVGPDAAFANSSIASVKNTSYTDRGARRTVADAAMSSIAANTHGMHPDDLGFIPRPNVPLMDRINAERINGMTNPAMRSLARAYLSQPVSMQQRARDYQAGNYVPDTPEARARAQALQAERERQAQKEIRRAARSEAAARARIPDEFKARAIPGNNITSLEVSHADNKFRASPFKSADGMRAFAATLIADYGGDEKFSATFHFDGDRRAVLRYSGSNGTSIKRSFVQNSDGTITVSHDFFRAADQGRGASKRFFRVAMGEYMAIGASKVKVHANIDVGGHVWARYGYVQTPEEWRSFASRTLTNKAHELAQRGALTAEEHATVKRILGKSDPRALWELSDYKAGGREPGKALLLYTDWYGTIDLSNREQMRRFTAYSTRS